MTAIEARSFWIVGPNRGELRSERLDAPGPDEVLIRTLYTGVSRGTESLVLRGGVPPEEYARMRAPFQSGAFPWPVKYGYLNVGVVEQGPAALTGRTVFCLYPHQTRYVVDVRAIAPLPPAVPAARAILAGNLETAVNALWDLGPRVGDRLAVIGAGAVGCLVAWLAARIPGCRVQLVDVDPGRARVAAALGVEYATPGTAADGCDGVVHASGSGDGLATALRLAGFEATVLELSWYGDRPVTVPLGAAFHAGRLTLRSSQVGSVATARRARRSHAQRLELALALLADERLDALITGESRFEALPRTLVHLATEPGDSICHRIVY